METPAAMETIVASGARCGATATATSRHICGFTATINMGKLMVRRHTLTGSTLRPRSAAFKAALADEIAREVWPLVADGSLRPRIDSVLPLVQAAEAHRRMEAGDVIGKIVLEVRGEN